MAFPNPSSCVPLIIGTTDGPTLTAAAAASCIPVANQIILPTNYWTIGKRWKVRATGRISSVITTPGTARFDVRMGTIATPVVCFDTLAILLDTSVAYTTVGWVLDVDLVCRAVGTGTTTTLFGQGTWSSPNVLNQAAGFGAVPRGGVVASVPWNTPPAVGGGFDNTINNVVQMFFTQTVATGSMTVHNYMIDEYI
jgi:hypothetical protein